MANKRNKSDETTTETMEEGGEEKATLVKRNESVLMAALADAGIDASDFVQTQTGGVTKWIDLKKFQEDPDAPDGRPVKGNGNVFAGTLMSRQEFDVDEEESGIEREDGSKYRNVYFLRLIAPCPVTWQDEEKNAHEGMAERGDIVAIGERHQLRKWRDLVDGGGEFIVIARPHSRIKISKVRTMWTFDTWQKTVRNPPPKLIVQQPTLPRAPF